jgi:pyruvate dehydrogenase E2 component (dihydrolipoamide acetyltransferase)
VAIEIRVPRLGWTMEEGTFLAWRKQDGETVQVGDALFALEGDKAVQEVEALDAGILRVPPDAPKPGEVVPVGALLAYLLGPGEALPWQQPRSEPAAGPAARRRAREMGVELGQVQGSGPAGRITPADVEAQVPTPRTEPVSSPRARRVARELGVDWRQLPGSGKGGRVRERDVRAAAGGTRLSPTRKVIAERLVANLKQTAPVTLTTKADASNLVNLRGQFQAASGPAPGYTDLLVKLAAGALQKHPALNACWQGEEIVLSAAVHIGLAVDTEAGLLVPVVRDVQTLTLRQLADATRTLVEAARARRLTAAQMQGGTFTVTNLGMYGIDAFTPLLNPPQCAVLGVGRIVREAVVEGERIVARERLVLSLTFDHRAVDGAPAARFLETLRLAVEQPGPWLIA